MCRVLIILMLFLSVLPGLCARDWNFRMIYPCTRAPKSPDMACPNHGTVHLTFSDKEIRYAPLDSEEIKFVSLGRGNSPSLAVDSQNRPSIAYKAGSQLTFARFYNSEWVTEDVKTEYGFLNFSHSIESTGTPLILAFVYDGPTWGQQFLFKTEPKILARTESGWAVQSTGLSAVNCDGQPVLDRNDSFHFSDSNTDTGMLSHACIGAAENRLDNIVVTRDFTPDYCLDAAGNFHICFCDLDLDRDLRYSTKVDGRWQIEKIPATRPSTHKRILTDPAGNPCILFINYRDAEAPQMVEESTRIGQELLKTSKPAPNTFHADLILAERNNGQWKLDTVASLLAEGDMELTSPFCLAACFDTRGQLHVVFFDEKQGGLIYGVK
ncbi:MAG: hypothetical protein PHQ23_09840 [Candidatus Wallbacteria bacterium]|nr:hypothetical protein [Candidatus Wallbacteria bacterium]